MPHPEFTVLLARQRSGTNALRSVLRTHADIYCFDEMFRRDDFVPADPLQIRGNFFTFLAEYGKDDITRTFPDRHEQVFTAYLAHLRGLTSKRYIVIDIKYNSTHHLSAVWRPIAQPTLFTEIQRRGIAVLHLTRRHYLRALLSHLKAWQSKRYYVFSGDAAADVPVNVPATWALGEFARWRAEDEAVAAAFEQYAFYKRLDYADLFTGGTQSIASDALQELRAWFDVADAFSNRTRVQKQSSLPLAATIENLDDVISALRGTPFEYCLEDEAGYLAFASSTASLTQ